MQERVAKWLGTDELIDYKKEDFSFRLKDYDAVLDTVGGETQKRSFKVLKKAGVLVTTLKPETEAAREYDIRVEGGMVMLNGARLQEIAGLLTKED